eukprot:XP_011670467.1 PREDICTED: vacuolar protein sorting-associated protein 11 homolog [Strongylocentrotus purpuratus]
MAFLQWRRFNFFDKEVVKYPDSTEIFAKLKDIDITASASGRGQVTLGDSEGNLLFLDRNLELDGFKAYELRVTHIHQLKQHNIIFTIGQDEAGTNPVIKVWNLDKRDKSNNPSCSRITRALPGSNATANVTAIAVSENLNMMAIGFQDGAVTLFKGDVTRDRVQDEAGTNPVIKVWNLDKRDKSNNPSCSRITRALPGSNATANVTAIAVSENLNMMAIGFQDGTVTLFKGDVTRDRHSKSPKVVHKGRMQVTGLAFRHTQRSNVLFISTENAVIACHIGAKDVRTETLDTMVVHSTGSPHHDQRKTNQFVIATTDFRSCCKLGGRDTPLLATLVCLSLLYESTAYSAPVPEVLDIIQEWGSLYVLGGDRKLYQLQEKDTQTKLEMLFKKNLYVMAIKARHVTTRSDWVTFAQYIVAKCARSYSTSTEARSVEPSYARGKRGCGMVVVVMMVRLAREIMMEMVCKGDHDGAIAQYKKTIGRLEPSYVIRKVCRQAGYFKHALFLAEKHMQHDWYLKVQLEDIKDYQKALNYITTLEFNEAMDNIKKYGKILMTEVPKEATDFLKVLCTDYKPADRPLVDPSTLSGGMPPPIQRASVEEFIHIFVNNSAQLMEFLEHMIKVQTESSSQIYNTLLELYLHDMAHETEKRPRLELERKAMALLQTGETRYDIDQALVLCQMHSFQKGILYLYEKAQLYQQILHFHMEHDSYDQIIEDCKRYGNQDPNLWVQALSYFAAKEENCKPYIVEVLSQIDRRNLLPPLLVIQTLAHNSTATLSVIKDYIVRRLQQENDQIADDERLIKQYREETKKMKSQIEEMKTSAKMFQVSKCSVCNHPLELPSVHFLCQHSYHQHCFESYAENEQECPACLPENRKVLDIIKAQEQSKDLHEQFHRQLEKSQDGFSVVADYFGRGVFNKVKK